MSAWAHVFRRAADEIENRQDRSTPALSISTVAPAFLRQSSPSEFNPRSVPPPTSSLIAHARVYVTAIAHIHTSTRASSAFANLLRRHAPPMAVPPVGCSSHSNRALSCFPSTFGRDAGASLPPQGDGPSQPR